MFISLLGTWVQSMAQSWLVFSLTRSAFLMGLVGFLSYLPVSFLSLAAGAYVDRSVKRNILVATQSLFAVLALALAVLVLTGAVRIWHVIVIAAFNGFVLSLDAPTRHAMIVDIAGRENLMNAIALNSAAFNSARIIGPALAGVFIAWFGMAGCFFVNALSYIPVLTVLFIFKPFPASNAAAKSTLFEDINESIDLLKSNRTMQLLLAMAGLVSTFGVSYPLLMPIFAQEILHSGVKGLAYLMSASGIGALIGALNIARLKSDSDRMKVMHFSVILFFLSAMAFSISFNLLLSCALLVLAGAGAAGSMSIVNAMLQTSVPDNHRGRIMGLFMTIFMGFIPFGSLLFGSLAQLFGVQPVIFASGLICLGIYLFLWKACLQKKLQYEK